MGMWPGPSFITCTPCCPGALGQVALGMEFGELRLVVGVGNGAGPQAVANGETHIVGGHDLADFVPVRVERNFPGDGPGTIWPGWNRRG